MFTHKGMLQVTEHFQTPKHPTPCVVKDQSFRCHMAHEKRKDDDSSVLLGEHINETTLNISLKQKRTIPTQGGSVFEFSELEVSAILKSGTCICLVWLNIA